MAILNFSDVLHNVGLDPKKVKLIRHALSDPGFRACYDVGMTLEYTKHQGMGFSKGYDYWVIFISDSGTYARLHSCCRVNGSEPDTPDVCPVGLPECEAEGYRGNDAFFHLEYVDLLKEYEAAMSETEKHYEKRKSFFDKLKEKVVNPLTGKKIGAYYGCLLLRPGKIMAFDDPENPRIMEDFIRALGAEPVIYPYRNECCGGYISLKEKEMSQNMCEKIEESAAGFGADMLITACPLCKYNLNKNSGNKMPVYYFTELLAEALGVKEEVAK